MSPLSGRLGVLGLFLGLGLDGGIQVSGRLAWEGVRNACPCATLFCYGPPPDWSRRSGAGNTAQELILAVSRTEALFRALRVRGAAEVILVWHLDLLKLLPFLRARAKRIVLFLHGIEAWRRLPLSLRWLLRRVDLFLSNSEHTRRRFLEFNPEFRDRPYRVVPLGVGAPVEGAGPPPGPSPGPAGPPIALMLGRMMKSEDYKGHREVIGAWPLVLERIPDARLWIAGDGDLRPELERMVRARGLGHHVRFWGWVPEETKQELLTQSRCLALPSRGEGFGLVYLEAMRMGRPCLVSTEDAGQEVVNPPEAGLAVDPKDPQGLADAVFRLLRDGSEWEPWSRQARKRYEQHFTARHFQERLIHALFDQHIDAQAR